MLKLLTVIVAGVLTAVTVRRVWEQFQAQKARVVARNPDQTRAVTRLRQDPRTGVYHPES
jgi:hypothetical protein